MNKSILEELSKDKTKPGAGFVVVRNFGGDWRVLGLKLCGMHDLPKGRSEKKDLDNKFITAQRECYEECSITVTPDDMCWGSDPLELEHLTIYLVKTEQDPVIRKNEKTGIYEHEAAEWLAWGQIEKSVYPYLRPAILWAQSKIKL